MEDLERIVKQLELENDKKIAADPTVRASMSVVEDFLKHHPVMCYGGTAINNLIPKEDRFYDPLRDVPDYDFFSKTPQEHSLILANQLSDAGIKNVEVKPGMHLGTFKVFADFAAVADITHLDEEIFERIWEEKITKNEINYVTPNFLRMSMYLELSRPRGDVSRWTKVYERLGLLNKHYPLVCPGVSEERTPLSEKNRKEVEGILTKKNVILLGITASQLHVSRTPAWSTPVTLLAGQETIDTIVGDRKSKKHGGTELLSTHTDVYDDEGELFLRIYETAACHSYHATASGIKVASIPTILQFFFAYLYSGLHEDDITHVLCVAQRLMDLTNNKKKRRFAMLTPIDCLGKQDTVVDIRKHKAVLYEKLSTNKASADFLKYFFSYNPKVSATQRKKVRDQLKKTRKARSESSY